MFYQRALEFILYINDVSKLMCHQKFSFLAEHK